MAQFSVYITSHRAQSLGHRKTGVRTEAATAAGAAAKWLQYPELGHIVVEVQRRQDRLIGLLPGGMGI